MQQKLNGLIWTDQYVNIVKKLNLKLFLIISRKWSIVSRGYNRFTKNNTEWLNNSFKIPSNKMLTLSVSGRPNITLDVRSMVIMPQSDEDDKSDINQSFSEITLNDKFLVNFFFFVTIL